jgi:hypothetical protein
VFWGSFWPGLEGMKMVDHPDPDIFRMCKLLLCRMVRSTVPDFAVLDGAIHLN